MACNSLLLAEESVFFTAKFSNPDFGGSSRLVELQDVDGDTLETVVAALLTATIKLDRDNIERILHCADMLQARTCCGLSQHTLSETHAMALDLQPCTEEHCSTASHELQAFLSLSTRLGRITQARMHATLAYKRQHTSRNRLTRYSRKDMS